MLKAENLQLKSLNQRLVSKLEETDSKMFSALTDALMGKPIMRQLTNTNNALSIENYDDQKYSS